eukprot:Sspe_Gene.114215::Locus_99704_Transcript_3_4_Confidence_0.625_Length_372::g.114215::m.114215
MAPRSMWGVWNCSPAMVARFQFRCEQVGLQSWSLLVMPPTTTIMGVGTPGATPSKDSREGGVGRDGGGAPTTLAGSVDTVIFELQDRLDRTLSRVRDVWALRELRRDESDRVS